MAWDDESYGGRSYITRRRLDEIRFQKGQKKIAERKRKEREEAEKRAKTLRAMRQGWTKSVRKGGTLPVTGSRHFPV